ncbi:MAG TPA: ATP-binding protein [Burkholderiaceae bacterium]
MPSSHAHDPTPDLTAVLMHLPVGVLLVDPQSGQILRSNPEARRLLGWSGSDTTTSPSAEILPALAALLVPEHWRKLAAQQRGTREEVRLTLAGEPRWLQLECTRLSSDLGLLTLSDLSARHRLEGALRESDARFREVTDAVRECLFVTTPHWDRVHFSSPLLLDMLGLDSADLSAGTRLIRERVHPEDLPLYDSRLDSEARGSASDIVLRIQHPARGLRWLRLRTRTQRHPDHGPLVYAILADVTEEQLRHRELQRAHDAAAAASKVKSEFMTTMSHEIRTPMNGILGMTELLLATQLDEQQRHYADAAYASAEELMRLLDNVLDFARATAGEMALARRPLKPVQLATELLHRWRPAATAKGLALNLRLGGELPERVITDATRLHQLLSVLLDNAIKFTAEGSVVLSLAMRPEGLEFEVRDTGIGMAPAMVERLLRATGSQPEQGIVQADGSLSRNHGGAGLGLALAQQLATLLGGRIGVDSALGAGSCFRFCLPLADVAAAPQHEKSGTPIAKASVAPRPQTVLVVEDNAVNQEVVEEMLRQLGYEVELRADAIGGLRALCERHFDLVLMDIHLPGMDGMEALSLFRAGPGKRFAFKTPPGTPVVAVTANALHGDRQRLLQHGFDDYLAKPLRRRQLEEMLVRRRADRKMTSFEAPMDMQETVPDPAARPQPASSGEALVLDAEALGRLRSLDPSGSSKLMERVVAAYFSSLERLLADLAAARANGLDLTAVRHVAHTLKSSSASLGALEVARRCAEIELLAREGRGEGMDSLLDALLTDIERTKTALTALQNTAA